MLAFLDFEASSLGKGGFPIEVGWVFEDGQGEGHLIRPAPGWTEWDREAEAVHGISRDMLLRDGKSHVEVAARMVQLLGDYDLVASAPSWDGKWLSKLLRSSGYTRRTLTLRDSDDALRELAEGILRPVIAEADLVETVDALIRKVDPPSSHSAPAHRALADAEAERQLWLRVRTTAQACAESLSG